MTVGGRKPVAYNIEMSRIHSVHVTAADILLAVTNCHTIGCHAAKTETSRTKIVSDNAYVTLPLSIPCCTQLIVPQGLEEILFSNIQETTIVRNTLQCLGAVHTRKICGIVHKALHLDQPSHLYSLLTTNIKKYCT